MIYQTRFLPKNIRVGIKKTNRKYFKILTMFLWVSGIVGDLYFLIFCIINTYN